MQAGAQPEFTGPRVTPEQWRRLKPVLERCRELPAEQREAELRKEFSGEPVVLQYALELLAAHDSGIETETAAPIALDFTDRLLGKFRLHHLIDQGGCGAVYEASRIEPCQRVAVKILKTSNDQDKLRDRFEQEARILSSMQHPNIVQFLDWGEIDGHPYFAMEFVDGKRIDEYCRDKKTTLAKRLRLFQDICSGVQYAHNHEIVHRDLKPGNILVSDEFGQVKLLDFGVAKIMDPQMWDCDPLTIPGFQPKTRTWASPEQLRDQRVTAATDIYSLGLLLRHLLSRGISDADRKLPVSASVSVAMAEEMREPGVASLRRKVRGELDAIVAKATAEKPDDRYQSAARLVDDIENYLNHRTVTAHPDSPGYRMRKFIGRNRLLVASVVLIFLTLSIGLGSALYNQHQAELARQEAERKRAEADSLNRGINAMVSQFGVVLQQMQREESERLAAIYGTVATQLEGDRNYRTALQLWEGARRLWEKVDDRKNLRVADEKVGRLKALAEQSSTIGAAAGGVADLHLGDGISPELLGEAFLTEGKILRRSGRGEEAADAYRRARAALVAAPASPRRNELLNELERELQTANKS